MKVYKVFTAHLTRAGAFVHCAHYQPFSSRLTAWMGFYEGKGWWLVGPGEHESLPVIVLSDLGDPGLELVSVERNFDCSDGSGDLLAWKVLDDERVIYSWAEYRGMATRLSKGSFRLGPPIRRTRER